MNANPPPADAVACTSDKVLSPAQFADAFQQCHSRLWLLAAAILGDRHMAEDVVQDAGIVALQQLGKFEPGTSFAAWMSQIVRLQAYNRSRKRTRRRTRSVDPVALDAQTGQMVSDENLPDPTKSLTAEQNLFDDEVMHALNDLRDVARACLLLRTLQQLSYNEIAAMLDIAEGTAMSHVHRAKEQLRKRLADQFSHTDTTKP
jgi:RNA polymerase sigma-70 factor (ECF subfamily)